MVVVANACQAMLFRAYFHKNSVPRKNVIAIVLRNTEVTNFSSTVIRPKNNRVTSFLWKNFAFSMSGLTLLMQLERQLEILVVL